MSYFRHYNDEEVDESLIRHIAVDSQNPIKKLLSDLVNNDLDIKSSVRKKELMFQYTKEIFEAF